MSDSLSNRVKELEDTVLALYVLLISQTVATDMQFKSVLQTAQSLIVQQQNALADIGEDGAVRALDRLVDQLNFLAE